METVITYFSQCISVAEGSFWYLLVSFVMLDLDLPKILKVFPAFLVVAK